MIHSCVTPILLAPYVKEDRSIKGADAEDGGHRVMIESY